VADDSGRGILLGLADEALRDRRLVAPQGRNAWEFYLSVLELEPDDAATRETLHRLFPAAIRAVEQAIDRGELDQAERELRLLREFDSGNYIAPLLAGKLDAQRQLLVRQHEARAAILQARRAAQPAR
jgi:protein TonB